MIQEKGKRRMKNKSVKNSLMMLCMTMVLIASVVIGAVAIISIKQSSNMALKNYEEAMDEGYQTEVTSEVQTVIAVLQSEYDKFKNGTMTEEEAQKEAMEMVRAMRYRDDASGYFWIDATDYTLMMHPILPENEGQNRHELEDKNGVMIIQEIMKVANSAEGAGFSEFYFTKADGVTVAPKETYSQIFKPWNWVVSTGNYVDDMDAEKQVVVKSINQKFVLMCVEVCVAALIILLITLFAARYYGATICKPLVQIQDLATHLSNGDLTTEIAVHSENELGKTAGGLNRAQAHMVELISSINRTSEDLGNAIQDFNSNFVSMGEAIQNVSYAVSGIADNSTSQACATTEASDGIALISDGISNTADEVESLDQNAKTMQEYSEKALETLRKLVEVNNKTKEDVNSMYAQTENTNASVKKIGSAATLISEISAQTNLLSLNASIEAARAGEAGRGFAVVAEEIGSLATQSAETVKEINDIIEELTTNSTKSVAVMGQMNEASLRQEEALENTGKMFEGLQEVLTSCVESVHSIADMIAGVHEQRERITQCIETLNGLATDNAASTEETASMATELKSTVERSNEIVETLSNDVKLLVENMRMFKL